MSLSQKFMLALGAALLFANFSQAGEDAKMKDPKDMKADEAEAAGICPVCKGESKPVYHYEFKGKDYHFKTRACQKEFAADPAKFSAIGKDWKPDEAKPADKKK